MKHTLVHLGLILIGISWWASPSLALAVEPQASLKGHKHTITCLAFSRDGRLLASGSKDTTVKIWDWRARKCLATLEGHVDMVVAVSFSHDSKKLATTSHGKVFTIWDTTGHELQKLAGHAKDVRAATFTQDGKTLITGSAD